MDTIIHTAVLHIVVKQYPDAFAVEEPFGFFEGDIVLDETTKRRIESRMNLEHVLERSRRGSQRHKRAIVKQEARLWTDGVVPYEVDKLLRMFYNH